MSHPSSSIASLGRQLPATWAFVLCPAAREGGGGFIPSRRTVANRGVRGAAADPERARLEAARRARRQLRLYCAGNRLNRLGTLTYRGEGCHDPRVVRAHVGEFFRKLRTELGGKAFPYAWVPEWHKTDHGLHLHFAVGQYIPRAKIETAWGRGFVHIKQLGHLPVGSDVIDEARHAAGYLSKYATKDFDNATRPIGLHRFDVAQGFLPDRIRLTGRTAEDLIDQASDLLGAPMIRYWNSETVEDWRGAPAIWAQW